MGDVFSFERTSDGAVTGLEMRLFYGILLCEERDDEGIVVKRISGYIELLALQCQKTLPILSNNLREGVKKRATNYKHTERRINLGIGR